MEWAAATTRRAAVRETGVSRNHGCSPETPQTSLHYVIEGFKKDP